MSNKDIKPIEPGYWVPDWSIPPGTTVRIAVGKGGGGIETVDDGSAAHEPDYLQVVAERDAARAEFTKAWQGIRSLLDAERETAAQIERLTCEVALLKGLLRAEDESKDGPNVAGDIERVIDHLVHGRTTRDQRKGIGDATERAERDAAVGRALR